MNARQNILSARDRTRLFVTVAAMIVTATPGLATLQPAHAHLRQSAGAADLREWWIYSEISILPESIAPGVWYRLANERSVGTLQSRVSDGATALGWGRLDANHQYSAGEKNVRLHRLVHDPNAGEYTNVGRFVRLNELVAIEMRGEGFLIQRDGRLKWERNGQYSPLTHPGVYQWRFEIVGQVNDHRRRTIRTKERLALFNIERKRYLVYRAREGNVLTWQP